MEGGHTSDNVLLIVGGIYYTINQSILEQNAEFARVIQSKAKSTGPIEAFVIEGDGTLFQYIYDYLRYGKLPRDEDGRLMISQEVRDSLLDEAYRYGLHDLEDEFTAVEQPKSELSDQVRIYNAMSESVLDAKWAEDTWTLGEKTVREGESRRDRLDYYGRKKKEKQQESAERIEYCKFVELLHSLQAPFCITGVLENISTKPFYKSSSVAKLMLPELIAEATLSPFGRGAETVIDTNVRHSYEIDVSDTTKHPAVLDVVKFIDLSSMVGDHIRSSYKTYELRPYKLAIYKQGGHFDAHRDTVRGEGHIGTLVVILNSEYTGGELEVTHGGRTETVTGAYRWVAMYGDCLHKIHPVTSGTRVSLIFDIYSTSKWSECRHNWDAPLGPKEVAVEKARGAEADGELRRAVVAGMHQQLRGYDSAVITLQHLYPACQARPSFLKGGDQLLYDTLQEHFQLAVLPCSLYHLEYHEEGCDGCEENECCVKPLQHSALSAEDSALAKQAAALKTKVSFSCVSLAWLPCNENSKTTLHSIHCTNVGR